MCFKRSRSGMAMRYDRETRRLQGFHAGIQLYQMSFYSEQGPLSLERDRYVKKADCFLWAEPESLRSVFILFHLGWFLWNKKSAACDIPSLIRQI